MAGHGDYVAPALIPIFTISAKISDEEKEEIEFDLFLREGSPANRMAFGGWKAPWPEGAVYMQCDVYKGLHTAREDGVTTWYTACLRFLDGEKNCLKVFGRSHLVTKPERAETRVGPERLWSWIYDEKTGIETPERWDRPDNDAVACPPPPIDYNDPKESSDE